MITVSGLAAGVKEESGVSKLGQPWATTYFLVGDPEQFTKHRIRIPKDRVSAFKVPTQGTQVSCSVNLVYGELFLSDDDLFGDLPHVKAPF